MTPKPLIITTELIPGVMRGDITFTQRVVSAKLNGETLTHDYFDGVSVCEDGKWRVCAKTQSWGMYITPTRQPYKIGDVCYVKEVWRTWDVFDKTKPRDFDQIPINYKADNRTRLFGSDDNGSFGRWRSPMFMPRWAARTYVGITNIVARRVQDMSFDDLMASMGTKMAGTDLRDYVDLWDTLNTKRGYPWESNPWVFGYGLKLLSTNGATV